jgi:ADP-heptose:LPS heptosyltransferase
LNICIFSYARLGDTICKLPSLWALRDSFPKAHICLVSQAEKKGAFITAKEVLQGTPLVDKFEITLIKGPLISRWIDRLLLILRMRKIQWDIGIALMPNYPPSNTDVFQNITRYLRYFGCQKIYSPQKIISFHKKEGRLIGLPHVADNMLQTINRLGIPTPSPQSGKFFLPKRIDESIWAHNFFDKICIPDIKFFAAVSLGANMNSNIWPTERYTKVLHFLWEKHKVAPIFFGSINLKDQFNHFIEALPVKFFCSGESIGRVAELMRKCSFYLGNDTGLMHLAVSTGLRCIMVSGSRNAPGIWEPYGKGHIVLRVNIECEGCLLEKCSEKKNRCLTEISVEEVIVASEKMINSL